MIISRRGLFDVKNAILDQFSKLLRFFFPNKKKKEKKRKLLVETRNVEELKRLVLT